MGYHKLHGKMEFQGLPVSVENRKGSKRYWTDEETGETGFTEMKHPYGYVRGTLGTDGDEVDVYVGPSKNSQKVFVITQNKKPEAGMAGSHPWVETDEQKVMLGFDSAQDAQASYLDHYDDPRFFGTMVELTMDAFKDQLNMNRGKLIKGKMADGGFTGKEAQRIAQIMDVDLEKEGISLREWTSGLNEELEHKDVTQAAAVKTGKIALAHLKEDSRYYAKLKKVVGKGLNAGRQPAIMSEDNIHMLVLSDSNVNKAFQPQALKPGGEATTKSRMVDTDPTDPEEETDMRDEKPEKKVEKATREEGFNALRKACASLSQEKMDLEKQATVDEDSDKDPKSDLHKALRAITVGNLTRRERLDAAYRLGLSQGKLAPRVEQEPAKLTNLNIGTTRVRPQYEPPVVPVRSVQPPAAETRPGAEMSSCTVHGYVHKSGNPCPICVQSRVSESTPFWRR